MHRLSDFKPLSRLELPDLGELKCAGLVVLVGPNSSGKSQLLQDLYKRLAGEARELVVAQTVDVDKPPFQPFLKCLEAEGYFSTQADEAGRPQLRPLTMYTSAPANRLAKSSRTKPSSGIVLFPPRT